MQIITEGVEAKAFLSNLRQTLGDKKIWEDWSAIDITATPPLDWIKQAKVTTLLRTLLPECDGSIVWLDDSILVLFQKAANAEDSDLMKSLSKAALQSGITLHVNYMGVNDSTEMLLEILAQRHREKVLSDTPEQPNYKYLKTLIPNIDELLEDWHKTRGTLRQREKPLIMVVDDDAFTLKLVGQALEKHYEVVTAKTGAEAITKHLQTMPDIIFLDIGLPDCDGITLLNYMQQYDTESRIVMFSADNFLKTRVKALAGGAKGYLSKPFNFFKFQEHIGEWLKQKSAPAKDDPGQLP